MAMVIPEILSDTGLWSPVASPGVRLARVPPDIETPLSPGWAISQRSTEWAVPLRSTAVVPALSSRHPATRT